MNGAADARAAAPHVTLVLGAGGPVGQAFHAGVLGALAEICGWDARAADLIVGTSAGAQVAALLRVGWDSHRLLQRATRPQPPPLRTATTRRWPASSSYLRRVASRPSLARLGPLIAALLPEGAHNGAHLGGAFQSLFPWHWPTRPLWIPAVHVDSGSRVVFGREDAPLVDVATAVRCSSAVPGLRRPIAVGGERYVDGGVASPTHADLVAPGAVTAADRRRVVVVLSPLSRFAVLRLLLRWELRAVIRHGTDLILFEPDRAVAAAMGWNPMDSGRVGTVADAAYRDTRRRLQKPGVVDAMRLLLGAQ